MTGVRAGGHGRWDCVRGCELCRPRECVRARGLEILPPRPPLVFRRADVGVPVRRVNADACASFRPREYAGACEFRFALPCS